MATSGLISHTHRGRGGLGSHSFNQQHTHELTRPHNGFVVQVHKVMPLEHSAGLHPAAHSPRQFMHSTTNSTSLVMTGTKHTPSARPTACTTIPGCS